MVHCAVQLGESTSTMPDTSSGFKLSLWYQDPILEEGRVNLLAGINGSLLVVTGDNIMEIKLVENNI